MCTHNDSVNLKESTAFKLGSSIPDDGESDDETKGESKLAIMQIRMRPRTNLVPQSAQVGTWKTVHQESYQPSVEFGHVDVGIDNPADMLTTTMDRVKLNQT